MDPITLIKGKHRWVFSMESPNDARAFFRRLNELCQDAAIPFDWFDAAMVSHQARQNWVMSPTPPSAPGE